MKQALSILVPVLIVCLLAANGAAMAAEAPIPLEAWLEANDLAEYITKQPLITYGKLVGVLAGKSNAELMRWYTELREYMRKVGTWESLMKYSDIRSRLPEESALLMYNLWRDSFVYYMMIQVGLAQASPEIEEAIRTALENQPPWDESGVYYWADITRGFWTIDEPLRTQCLPYLKAALSHMSDENGNYWDALLDDTRDLAANWSLGADFIALVEDVTSPSFGEWMDENRFQYALLDMSPENGGKLIETLAVKRDSEILRYYPELRQEMQAFDSWGLFMGYCGELFDGDAAGNWPEPLLTALRQDVFLHRLAEELDFVQAPAGVTANVMAALSQNPSLGETAPVSWTGLADAVMAMEEETRKLGLPYLVEALSTLSTNDVSYRTLMMDTLRAKPDQTPADARFINLAEEAEKAIAPIQIELWMANAEIDYVLAKMKAEDYANLLRTLSEKKDAARHYPMLRQKMREAGTWDTLMDYCAKNTDSLSGQSERLAGDLRRDIFIRRVDKQLGSAKASEEARADIVAALENCPRLAQVAPMDWSRLAQAAAALDTANLSLLADTLSSFPLDDTNYWARMMDPLRAEESSKANTELLEFAGLYDWLKADKASYALSGLKPNQCGNLISALAKHSEEELTDWYPGLRRGMRAAGTWETLLIYAEKHFPSKPALLRSALKRDVFVFRLSEMLAETGAKLEQQNAILTALEDRRYLGNDAKAPVNWHDLMYSQTDVDEELFLCLKGALSAMKSGSKTYWDLIVNDMIAKMIESLTDMIKEMEKNDKWVEGDYSGEDDWDEDKDDSGGYDWNEYNSDPRETASEFFRKVVETKSKRLFAVVSRPEIENEYWEDGQTEIDAIHRMIDQVTQGLLDFSDNVDEKPSVQFTYQVDYRRHNTYVGEDGDKIMVYKGFMSLEMRSLANPSAKPVAISKWNTPPNRIEIWGWGEEHYYDLPQLDRLKEFPKMMETLLRWMVYDF